MLGLVHNAVTTKSGDVWEIINKISMLRQTVEMLDPNGDKQRAYEERFAWDFSLWYVEGYTKGKKPSNRMENLLQRICKELAPELKLIGSIAQRLQSDGWQAISDKSMQTMFENMSTRANQQEVAETAPVQEQQ